MRHIDDLTDDELLRTELLAAQQDDLHSRVDDEVRADNNHPIWTAICDVLEEARKIWGW